jgi:3-methyladenine DNA glycosylase AlkD
MTAADVQNALESVSNANDATFLQRFFKTGLGQYGEGDIFIGVRVPATRKVCKRYATLALNELQILLDSPVHEHRLAGLIISAQQFPQASLQDKTALYDFYLHNLATGRINNWDLIDTSSEYILGAYLKDNPKDVLYTLAHSDSLWERRAAMLATFAYIKSGDATDAIKIAEILLHDKNDLIQKAVGWMLREIGKRVDRGILLTFLDRNAKVMPRTMLRYAIEHLDPTMRAHYMKLKDS